jgi:hypothetical protein
MRLMIMLVAMIQFAALGYSAETITFTDEDVQKAPLLFKSNRVISKSKSRKKNTNMEEEQAAEEQANEEKVEEEEVIDSFVVFKGNRRFHIASCKLVTKNRGARTTVNGAKAIEARYNPCGTCSPKAYKNPPTTKGKGAKKEIKSGEKTTPTKTEKPAPKPASKPEPDFDPVEVSAPTVDPDSEI